MNKTKKSDDDDEEDFLANLTFGEDPVEHEKKLMRHYDRLAKDVLEEHFTTQVCPLLVCSPPPDYLFLCFTQPHTHAGKSNAQDDGRGQKDSCSGGRDRLHSGHTRTTQTDTHTYMHTRTHACMHACTHTHAGCTHTHTCAHAHTNSVTTD